MNGPLVNGTKVICTTNEYRWLEKDKTYTVRGYRISNGGNYNYKICASEGAVLHYWCGNFELVTPVVPEKNKKFTYILLCENSVVCRSNDMKKIEKHISDSLNLNANLEFDLYKKKKSARGELPAIIWE